MAFKNEKELRKHLDSVLKFENDLSKITDIVNKKVNQQLANRTKIEEVSKDIVKIKKEELKLNEKANKVAAQFESSFGKIASKLEKTGLFKGKELEKASRLFRKNISSAFKDFKKGGGVRGFFEAGSKGIGSLAQSLSVARIATAGLVGGAILIGTTFIDQFNKIDEAVASVVKTSGVLDNSLNTVLINATESSNILGGDIQLAADAANELYKQLSPAVPLTGKIVGNVARISERFGLGVDNATKLTRIISQTTGASIENASDQTESFITGLGRLGPAIVRNITDSYETVINSFGLGLQQLKQQGIQATNLGISLSDAAETAKGLLDISSSITSEFKARALLGGDLNLQRARQLSFEGDIVGANQEILNQVEKIGDLSKLNTFQRQSLAEATGKTVAELQRELKIRRTIGNAAKLDEATRRSALTQFEAISRRIQSAFFKIVASPEVQKIVNTVADKIVEFLDSGKLQKLIMMASDIVDAIGKLISGNAELSFNLLTGFSYKDKTSNTISSLNDGIITNTGEVVSTDPKDYIIAMKNPTQLIENNSNVDMRVVDEMVKLLKYLKDNGITANTYLDGQKVSKKLAMSGR